MALRILFISNNFSPFIGGIEVISQMLAQAFTNYGHEVHLLTWSQDNSGQVFPFRVIRKPSFITLIKEHYWADLVFENNPSLRLSWPNLIFNKPSVVTLQTWLSRKDGTKSFIDKLKLKGLTRATKVIACSNAVKTGCWPQALVIENPFQEKLFREIPEIPRDRDFVFLGRMVSDKGAELAIKAFHRAKIHDENKEMERPQLFLTMIGDGPERKKLEKLANEFNLNDQIEFTGYLQGERLVNCLNRHRFMLVPSIWEEPFGIVVLEGMASGCLPIVSDGGGLPEAIGNSGFLFKRGDLDDLTNCMLEVLKNPGLVQQCHDNFKHHLALHKLEVVAKRYLEVIDLAFQNKQTAQIQEHTF